MSTMTEWINLTEDRGDLLFLINLAASGRRLDQVYDYTKRLLPSLVGEEIYDLQLRKHFCLTCNLRVEDKLDTYNYIAKIVNTDQKRTDAAKEYLQIISEEIDTFCWDVIKTIDYYFFYYHRRIYASWYEEHMTFYIAMKVKFFRHLAMVNTNPEEVKRIETIVKKMYPRAKEYEHFLWPTNPTRLDMHLSFAQFKCEASNDQKLGYREAREAYEFAMKDLKGNAPSEETARVLNCLEQFLFRWKEYAT